MILAVIIFLILAIFAFCVFFDHAVLTRKGTIYKIQTKEKLVALTFDDGPSPIWTPQILEILKSHNARATFFMIGKHVEKYPEIVKRVHTEGHDIGSHTYLHHVLVYYRNDELRLELDHTAELIKIITARQTQFFRPPKAWLFDREKNYIKRMGYQIILWTLNSKDWVTFYRAEKNTKYLLRRIKPGYIILFHDSGNTFSIEGGNRTNTVKTIARLIPALQTQGYRLVTVSELLRQTTDSAPSSACSL